MIRIVDLKKTFGMGETEVRALRGVDLEVEEGDFVAIQGPSGCGKSTLLNMIGCLDRPTSGNVFIDGVDTSLLNDNELAKIRREKMGFIFQKYNLIPTLNALENVKLPMMFAGVGYDSRVERAVKLLELVGIGERMYHKPPEMSGGEQQRVAIARALSNDPPLIIGDEMTGNLDTKTSNMVMEIAKRLSRDGKTIIIVTHNPAVAAMAHRIIYIEDGVLMREELKNDGER
ncbi:MAG: putative ABC transporter ATP-binding protein YknY [Syntrophomonadaceae bacterium]|nr:putative ABC transporter ATP-binding protein YknY [Bacillota bacterium]